MTMRRNLVLGMLFITVIAPMVLYTDRLGSFMVSSEGEFAEDNAISLSWPFRASEPSSSDPDGVLYSDDKSFSERSSCIESSDNDLQVFEKIECKSTRMLSMMNEEEHSEGDNSIKLVTDQRGTISDENKEEEEEAVKVDQSGSEIRKYQLSMPDSRVRQLRDQLIRAKLYLSLPATRNNPHFRREIRVKMKDVQRALGDAIKDSDLSRKIMTDNCGIWELCLRV